MKRRILALFLALVMAVGLVMPASAEGVDGTTLGGDGAPVVITGDGVTTTPPADTDTPTPVDGDDDGGDGDESDTPAPADTPAPTSLLGAAPLGAAAPVALAAASVSTSYLDVDGSTKSANAIPVTDSDTPVRWGAEDTTTWYVVNADVTINDTVMVDGDVNLILADGKTLTVTGKTPEMPTSDLGSVYGINVKATGSLTVYGQTNGTGKLTAKTLDTTTIGAACPIYTAGISLFSNPNARRTGLTINGGTVTATGGGTKTGERSYGVYASNAVVINGGTLIGIGGEATGSGSNSVGIASNVTLNGGTLIAKTTSSSGTKAAFSAAPTLPSSAYYWRTVESVDYTPSTTTAYSYDSSNTYVELTTTPSGGGYISYKDWDGSKLVDAAIEASKSAEVPTTTESESVTWGEANAEKWYYVEGNVEIDEWVTVTGNVNLILCDGATLTVESSSVNGIQIDGGSSGNDAKLTIYGQSQQTGALTSKATGSAYHGIHIINGGQLTINGGNVTATGSDGSARYGINVRAALTINSGKVTATGSSFGIWESGYGVTFNGGTLIAMRSGNGDSKAAIAGTFTRNPSTYWWRTAAGAKYKTQNTYTADALTGKYFEITTTKPADDQLDRVGYLDWNSTNNELNTTLSYRDDATKVTNSTNAVTWGEANAEKWYYVEGNVTIGGTVNVTGNVNLILCDNATLEVTASGNFASGIQIGDGSSGNDAKLTIYGQSSQTGKLVANGGNKISGIVINKSSLTINGGVITATGGNDSGNRGNISYGISISGGGSSMTVNSGKVTATGGSAQSQSRGICLENGNVSLTVNGGEVTATGSTATTESMGIRISSGTMTINGGVIEATGGTESMGISIGSGTIMTFNGGTVIAKSGNIAVSKPSRTILGLPLTYWWRTAESGDDAKYKTQNTYNDEALAGTYFEITTTEQANVESDPAIPYVDASGAGKSAEDYIVLRNNSGDVTLTDGWYVVNSDVTIGGKLTIDGNVHLILCDGAKLTVNKGVEVDDSGTNAATNRELTIYGQSGQTGKLVANGGVNGGFSAGISSPGYGKLTINGGVIEATGADDKNDTPVTTSYGIHAMYLVINGGTVNAKGGKAVGVPDLNGNGSTANSGGIHVVGEMKVNGGTVTANGGAATGGENADYAMSCGIYADELTINGGKVTANGKEASDAISTMSVGIYATNMFVGNMSAVGYAEDDTPSTTTGAVVNATGGAAGELSCGIFVGGLSSSDVDNGMYIGSGAVTATGGAARSSIGLNTLMILVADGAELTANGGSSTGTSTVKESYGIRGVLLWMGDLGEIGGGDDPNSLLALEDEDVEPSTTSGDAKVTATGGTAEDVSCGIEIVEYGGLDEYIPLVLLNGGELTATGTNYGINVTNVGINAAAYDLDDDSTGDAGASLGTVTIVKGTLIADATGTGHGLDLDKGDGESYSLVCPDAYLWRINKAVNGYRQFPSNAYAHNNLNDYVEITTEGEGLPLLPDSDPTTTHKHTRRQNTAVADLIPTPGKTDVASPETFDAGIAVYAVMGAVSAAASAAWIGKRKKR